MLDGERSGGRSGSRAQGFLRGLLVLGVLSADGGEIGAAESAGGAAEESTTESSERPRHFGGQRTFGLGPAAGFYSGLGGVVTLETDPVGLVAAGGYMPIMIFGNEGPRRSLTFDYYDSAQLNLDLRIGPVYRGRKVDVDLLFGYRYNSVLGHGGGAGARIGLDLSRVLRLEFHWTPHLFPAALDRLRDRGYPTDRDASLPWFQGGVGAAAVFYP